MGEHVYCLDCKHVDNIFHCIEEGEHCEGCYCKGCNCWDFEDSRSDRVKFEQK